MDKKELSKSILDKRMSYSVLERAPWDKNIHDYLMDICSVHSIIALYASFRNEVDMYGVMESLWLDNKIVVLPKVIGDELVFYKVYSFDDLESGSLGILEPKSNLEVIDKSKIDIVVVPLLAYNKDKYRIGYGKGYYDRYLKDYQGLKIGVAYDFQELDVAFQEDFDVACDVIVTQQGVI